MRREKRRGGPTCPPINGAFTLLELLAAVALLVMLGSMLFQIFGKASDVVRISNARQEIYQYARAALEFIEREAVGAFTGVDAVITADQGIKGMYVYNQASMGSYCDKRADSQGIFFSTGLLARDTRETVNGQPNPLFGHDVNVARVAYHLNNELQKLDKSAIYRTEMYDLTLSIPEEGGPFVRNCLFFNIKVYDQFSNVLAFQTIDWNSDETISVGGNSRRRGLPQALYFRMRITDERHAQLYHWDSTNKEWRVPGPDGTLTVDHWGEEDPIVQTFSQVVYLGKRVD